MMEFQPVGMKRLKEEAKEEKTGLKKKYEDQDQLPSKKLVDHRSLWYNQSINSKR